MIFCFSVNPFIAKFVSVNKRSFLLLSCVAAYRGLVVIFAIFVINCSLCDALSQLARVSEHIHTHRFNGPLSGTTRVSRYQKGKTNLDFSEARDSEWQWHPTTWFFTGRMPFLKPSQQCHSTEALNTYR